MILINTNDEDGWGQLFFQQPGPRTGLHPCSIITTQLLENPIFCAALAAGRDGTPVGIQTRLTQILRIIIELEHLRIVEILATAIHTCDDLKVVVVVDASAASFYRSVIIDH